MSLLDDQRQLDSELCVFLSVLSRDPVRIGSSVPLFPRTLSNTTENFVGKIFTVPTPVIGPV